MDMKKLWRWLLIALGIVVIRSTTETKPKYEHSYNFLERQVMNEINFYRSRLGIHALKINDDVSMVCTEHSGYMAANLNVCHDGFPDRMQRLTETINAKSVGEVVAFGYSTASGVVNGWIRSDSHRVLLERESYTDFGISAYKNNAGRYYFTVIFTKQ